VISRQPRKFVAGDNNGCLCVSCIRVVVDDGHVCVAGAQRRHKNPARQWMLIVQLKEVAVGAGNDQISPPHLTWINHLEPRRVS
jgi:hypothetical protein